MKTLTEPYYMFVFSFFLIQYTTVVMRKQQNNTRYYMVKTLDCTFIQGSDKVVIVIC